MKKFKIYLLVIIFFITGLLLGKSLQSTTPVTEVLNDKAIAEQAEDISIMFIFDDQNILTADFAYQEDLNLLAATRLASEQNNLDFDSKDYGEMGSLITQIGNKINGNNNLYWQYWINNQQVQVSADRYILASGDIISWQFRGSSF